MVVVPHLTRTQAETVLHRQRQAGVFDGPAGVVPRIARSRGWTALSGDPERIRHVDPGGDIQPI
jgi:hypothetical protein